MIIVSSHRVVLKLKYLTCKHIDYILVIISVSFLINTTVKYSEFWNLKIGNTWGKFTHIFLVYIFTWSHLIAWDIFLENTSILR